MRVMQQRPPRRFQVGTSHVVTLKDCGRIVLNADEQVTFVTPAGAEYDVARKSWGFYATPSLNNRLKRFGLRAVLMKNPQGRYGLLLVDRAKVAAFRRYAAQQQLRVIAWLDSDRALHQAEQALCGRRLPAARRNGGSS